MTAPSPAQLKAYDEGRAAYEGGQPVTVCPYDGGELRVLFCRGYQHARRDAQLAELEKNGA